MLRKTTGELALDAGGGILAFGIVARLWFASGGVNSMISALNLAHHAREARSWWKIKLVALGLTLAICI